MKQLLRRITTVNVFCLLYRRRSRRLGIMLIFSLSDYYIEAHIFAGLVAARRPIHA